jgi:uncharacterized protein YukJ
MSLKRYGVLAGRVVDHRREAGKSSPHYQIHLVAAGFDFRLAVNVLSSVAPSELLYLVDEDFRHPLLDRLAAVPDGFTALRSAPGDLALDFVRGNLFDRTRMRPLPPDVAGPDNDLADVFDRVVTRAENDASARLFAFGDRFGPEEDEPDEIFHFLPGNGIHEIHMNQGNDVKHVRDDGVWQDGALLADFPGASRWVAVFLAFQSQSWVTDDVTGHALVPPKPPAASDGHAAVRIVAALVNPVGPAPEAETVTLVNTTPAAVDLVGWTLTDARSHRFPLPAATVPAGETVRIGLAPPIALGNRGGTISLFDADGRKSDGVSYTSADADEEGRTIVFRG